MDDDELGEEEELDEEESLVEGDDDLDEALDGDVEDDELGTEPAADDDDDDESADDVPSAKAKRNTDDDDDDDDDEDPDDVEADLDTILKDRIAAGDDDEDDDEVEEPGTESGERVAAKTADEFTCPTCFLIVHPRQFGRSGALTCPEGYDPCGGMAIVVRGTGKASKAKKA